MHTSNLAPYTESVMRTCFAREPAGTRTSTVRFPEERQLLEASGESMWEPSGGTTPEEMPEWHPINIAATAKITPGRWSLCIEAPYLLSCGKATIIAPEVLFDGSTSARVVS